MSWCSTSTAIKIIPIWRERDLEFTVLVAINVNIIRSEQLGFLTIAINSCCLNEIRPHNTRLTYKVKTHLLYFLRRSQAMWQFLKYIPKGIFNIQYKHKFNNALKNI